MKIFKEIDIKKVTNIFTISIIIVLIVLLSIYTTKIILKKYVYVTKYEEIVKEAAANTNLDPYLIFSIIKQESKFNEYATSKKNAKGLMQVLDSTAKEMSNDSEVNLYDAATNINVGSKYFKSLLDRYNGNLHLAICAYNAGLGNVDKWITSESIFRDNKLIISNIPFKETREYLINILNYYDKYVELYK